MTLIEFLAKNLDHPLLPAATGETHFTRDRMMFMDDPEGKALLACYYHQVIKSVPDVARHLPDSSWDPVRLPVFETDLEILPDSTLQCQWRPDGTARRSCGMILELGDQATLDGVPLLTLREDDLYRLGWPEDLKMTAAVRGPEGSHTLTIRPVSFDPRKACEDFPYEVLAEAHLLPDWTTAVWEWQKVALAWLAIHRIE